MLRLWAATVESTKDAHIGPSSLSNAAEKVRRLRNAIKFILGNAQRAQQPPPHLEHVQLSLFDRFVLHELADMERHVIADYDDLYFPGVVQRINNFVSGTLSSFYFEEAKDILYCDQETSPRRQAVAAVLGYIVRRLIRMLAPVTSHLCEEVAHHIPDLTMPVDSAVWDDDSLKWVDDEVKRRVEPLVKLRQSITYLVEEARADK